MPRSELRRDTSAVAATTAQVPPPLSKKRRILIWTLVVLASVIALVSILTTWVNRQMLDNSAWNRATTQVIEDPKVQASIATYTVDQLYENINVAQALANRLPPTLQPLAPTLAGALQQPATRAVTGALTRPRIQQLFIQVSAIAHQKLVNVLENKTGYGISTGNGDVTLNLHQFVVEIGTELGIPQDALAKLPNKAGTITLMRSDQLSAAQAGIQAVRVLSVWLLVAVLALYGIAIWLARGARRATLRNAGVGFALVGLLVLVLRRLLGNYITTSLASPGYQPATHRLWLIGTSILGQIGAAALLYGAIAVLGAVLAGPSSPAVWLRQRLAPVLNERQGIVWGAVAFVYLLLILWGGTHALRVWWGILLIGGLIALGVVALRRQTLQEFPPGGGGSRARCGRRPPTTSPRPPSEAGALEKGAFGMEQAQVAGTWTRPGRAAPRSGGSAHPGVALGDLRPRRLPLRLHDRGGDVDPGGLVCLARRPVRGDGRGHRHGWWRVRNIGLARPVRGVGVVAFVHPENTFKALASIFAFYLLLRGTFDIVVAILVARCRALVGRPVSGPCRSCSHSGRPATSRTRPSCWWSGWARRHSPMASCRS